MKKKELRKENDRLEKLLKFWQEKGDKRLGQIKGLEAENKDLKYEKSLLESRNQGLIEQLNMLTGKTPLQALTELRGLEKPNPTVGGPGSCIQKGAENLDEIQKTVQKEWQEGFVEAALSGNPTKIQAAKGVLDKNKEYFNMIQGMDVYEQEKNKRIEEIINGNPV
jgi:hypothetical protein